MIEREETAEDQERAGPLSRLFCSGWCQHEAIEKRQLRLAQGQHTNDCLRLGHGQHTNDCRPSDVRAMHARLAQRHRLRHGRFGTAADICCCHCWLLALLLPFAALAGCWHLLLPSAALAGICCCSWLATAAGLGVDHLDRAVLPVRVVAPQTSADSRCCSTLCGWSGRRRDCHFTDTPFSSILKHLLKVEGGAAE